MNFEAGTVASVSVRAIDCIVRLVRWFFYEDAVVDLEFGAVYALQRWGGVQLESSSPIAPESAWFQPLNLKCDILVSHPEI